MGGDLQRLHRLGMDPPRSVKVLRIRKAVIVLITLMHMILMTVVQAMLMHTIVQY